ncbi:glycerol kinase [Williamsoniiplasma luminosum]|uniref:Glycerol kinase n=1 Tax=Williamsoniiplasma luminosum TaxID=214888 RepID=A0A2K8NSS7_9MOLU|nr:glycerol kinase GlpK [Williamsoniiplasma luminosum]ATZ16905.1 glycerol kinase [Williamsoniiplasma luminosum]AVP49572.1 MAG: glycerol kinase [Williamsoniiplasma luminosum]
MEKYIVTLDEGTTSARTLVTNKKGEIIAVDQTEFTQFFPNEGWVEHDAIEIWNAQHRTLVQAINHAKITSDQIAAIGITNQRETVVVWNRTTGLPIYNAIVWQDQRTANKVDTYTQKEVDLVKQKTGLIVHPYFSATKVEWILDNVEGARKLADNGELMFGNINTWLIYRLTAGELFITDHTNAQRTLLYNIETNDWDDDLLKLFNIPRNMLPEIKSCSENYGLTYPGLLSKSDKNQIIIASSIGDQQSALFGQLCVNPSDVKITYGTGCFILMNTGEKIVRSSHGLVTTVALAYDNKITYALEGSVMIAGAAVQWLRDNLKIVYSAIETEWYAGQVKDDRRIYVVPSFTGLGAPYWDSYSRGAMFGLDRGTKREHIVRATLESIAYQANDVISAMRKDMNNPISELKVDGGASNNKFLMQFQSDLSQVKVIKPLNVETTAMGAAYLAGLAVGYWKNVDDIKNNYQLDLALNPQIEQKEAQRLIKGWTEAVKRTFSWTKDIE